MTTAEVNGRSAHDVPEDTGLHINLASGSIPIVHIVLVGVAVDSVSQVAGSIPFWCRTSLIQRGPLRSPPFCRLGDPHTARGLPLDKKKEIRVITLGNKRTFASYHQLWRVTYSGLSKN